MRYFHFALLALIALVTVGCGSSDTGTYFKVDKDGPGPYSISIFDSRWCVDRTGPSPIKTGKSVWNKIDERTVTDDGFVKLKGTSDVKVGDMVIPAFLTYKMDGDVLIYEHKGEEVKFKKHSK